MSTASRRRMALADMLRNELEIETKDSTPLADIFMEEPPTLTSFVQDQKYLDKPSVHLSMDQHDFVRHFEQVLYPETYILMVEEFGEYWNPVRFCNEFAIEWGKGSGKDFVCQISFSRVSNILLCLKNPQEYYGLDPDTYIHMLNVAASAPQAHSVFFKPLRASITRSKWFADKFEGEEPGPQATEIRFKRQIELVSGHSQAATLEGKNLVAGIADEISEFPTEDEVAASKTGRTPAKTAKAILSMLKTSGATRFPETYRLAQISFPRFKGDAIEQAVAKAKADLAEKGEKSRYYAAGPSATWEVNPRYDKYERIEVPGATQPVPNVPVFIEDYATDPAEARAKYECKPELAERRFLNNDEAIYAAFAKVREVPPIAFNYYWGLDDEGSPSEAFADTREAQVPGWQVKFDFAPDFRPVMGALYVMHGDMAISGDRAGVALAHVRSWDRRDWPMPGGGMVLESRPIVKVDFAGAFEADARAVPAPREVQIRWYRKLVWELRSRGFMIMGVSFDNFQSADSMQILSSWGIETRKASTDRSTALYDTLRDVLYDSRLEGYYNERLIGELRRLSKLRNGKIDHPPGGCFVGETRIPLLDGTRPMISELDGSKVWVYSATPEGKIVPGFAKARLTKYTKELVDVVLDNGYVARCTPEHLWMLRDGSYKEAQNLVPAVDRLMPITFNWPCNGGYERVTDKDGVRTLTHHMVAQHVAGRKVESGEHVHHHNEVKTDNRPENLSIVSHVDHVREHGIERWESRREAMAEGHEAWRNSERFSEDMAKRDMSWVESRDWQAQAKKHPLYRNDITVDSLREVLAAQNANDAARRLGCGRNVVIARLREAGYATWEEFRETADNNHKVRCVEKVTLDSPVPVYDLEVDEWHNFALTGGVFVHNSKDIADAVAGAVAFAVEVGGDEGEEVEYADEEVLDVALYGSVADRLAGNEMLPDDMYGAEPLGLGMNEGLGSIQW